MKKILPVLLLSAVLIAGCHRGETRKTYQIKGINSLITNAMSDSLGMERLDRDMNTFMQRWWIRGLSLSVMRGDSLLYAKGYGKADEDVPMEPGKIMRIASVSKLVTAAGIMKLQEQGKLRLPDRVFGPSGILNDSRLRVHRGHQGEGLFRHHRRAAPPSRERPFDKKGRPHVHHP